MLTRILIEFQFTINRLQLPRKTQASLNFVIPTHSYKEWPSRRRSFFWAYSGPNYSARGCFKSYSHARLVCSRVKICRREFTEHLKETAKPRPFQATAVKTL
jgi:hypothetical protein